MDRRNFLSTSLAAFAAFKVLPPLSAEAPTGPVAVSPSLPLPLAFSAARFRSLLGSRFTIQHEGVSESLKLTDVQEGPRSPGLEQFTTVFTCKNANTVAAGYYKVYHPALGRFELRIDRQAREGQSVAVFNLIV